MSEKNEKAKRVTVAGLTEELAEVREALTAAHIEAHQLREQVQQANGWLLEATKKADHWYQQAMRNNDKATVLDAVGQAIAALP